MSSAQHTPTELVSASLAVDLTVAGCVADQPPAAPVVPSTAPSSAGRTHNDASAARSVGPLEFAREMADRVTVNVHVPYAGEIAGTDMLIPFDQIAGRTADLPAERSTPLAIYCRSDRMSRIATQTLFDLGYHDIIELHGGMAAWEQSGRALVSR